MKSIKILSLAVAFTALSCTSNAQSKTETYKVNGNCGMCKSKIEKAAKEAGAKDASWDMDKKELTVTYKTSSTNAAKIQQKVAESGYDNAGFKATTDAYNKLHGCCKYNRTASPSNEVKAACCSGDAKCGHHADTDHKTMDCCKDGKCTKEGHSGKDCCKAGHDAMSCCKDGKCTNEGHCDKPCCKK
jgi:periplasmic mercuric ion binding protein